MGRITGGDWYVPTALRGDEAEANGQIVVVGQPDNATLVADCRNDFLPGAEVRSNARAIAALPRMVMALAMAETLIGDLPQTPTRKNAHAAIMRALILSGQLPGKGAE
jgi:hypothetical protein